MINVAINGFGRIGRNILRALYEGDYRDMINVVAINDLAPLDDNLHLLQYDSTHGRFATESSVQNGDFVVSGNTIKAFNERDPSKLPWKDLEIDVVLECTGFFRDREGAKKHLSSGAQKVLISAPGKDLDATVVYGVNDASLKPSDCLVSNASCTTNCLAHLATALHNSVGIRSGLATTIHAYTNTQSLLDSYHKDRRRARAAAYSMIPTSTGSAKTIGKVIPELDGVLDAVSVRVPTLNVSLLDLTFVSTRTSTLQELRKIFEHYAVRHAGLFALSDIPLVSIDFNHHPASCVVDWKQTRIVGDQIKVQAWYDNEWAFSNRMLDTTIAMQKI